MHKLLIACLMVGFAYGDMGYYSTLQYGHYKRSTGQEARFGINYKAFGYSEVYLEHIANLSNSNSTDGIGLNIAGASLSSPKWNGYGGYAGMFIIPRKYNEKYREAHDDANGYRFGVEKSIGDSTSIYFEHFNGKQNSIGVKWQQ